jgi:hypothetical protein
MPDQWMTIAEAAAALRVHPRTVERRIASNKIETSRGDDGQVRVLINMPDTVEADVPQQDFAFETVRELADRQVDIAAGSASAIVRYATEAAERSQQDLALARQDAGRARRDARLAWGVVGMFAAGVTLAVAWCMHTVTAARTDARHLSQRIQQVEDTARQLETAREAARKQAEDAAIARAHAEGQLAAYVEQAEQAGKARPTTRPTFLARLGQALMDE